MNGASRWPYSKSFYSKEKLLTFTIPHDFKNTKYFYLNRTSYEGKAVKYIINLFYLLD